MIGSQIIFQIYATHASGSSSSSNNRPKFPPDILPPYDFDTMGEIHVKVIAQNKVRVKFVHESQNMQVELNIQAIEHVTESPSIPLHDSKHNSKQDSKHKPEQAPITVYRCTMDHTIPPAKLINSITSSTMILHMYDERAIVSLAYDIHKHERSWKNAITAKATKSSETAKTYWLQGISPLGYHQVDLGLNIESNHLTQ